ncbi:uncharacterized protein LODBEIA_P41910 [Lodderomyces beijingensis]|uniref:Uncharacterized protein n=1 Tax=Lodderomyces beijingensis TaxID=1775926 RepID=A0ABP0ZRI8_9ASCO
MEDQVHSIEYLGNPFLVSNIRNDNEVQVDDNNGGNDIPPTHERITDLQTEMMEIMEYISDSDHFLDRGIAIGDDGDQDDEDEDDADHFYDTRRESFDRNEEVRIARTFYNVPPKTHEASASASASASAESNDIDHKFHYVHARSSAAAFTLPADLKISDNKQFIFPFQPDKFRNQDFGNAQSHDPVKLVQRSPAEKFHNGLKLESLGFRRVAGFEDSKKYKNNLTCIMNSGPMELLVIASNSELFFYMFDPLTHLPSPVPCLRFDTRPPFTSSTDRLISTWPYFPHTINYIKCGEFNHRLTLFACVDDGLLLIWYTEKIMHQIEKYARVDGKVPDFSRLRMNPDHKIKLSASLWGLDFRDNVIVASDNSQSVVLIYFDPTYNRFYHITSHQVLHNIPDVSIIKFAQDEVQVACASISGELVIFVFKFVINQGPLNKDEVEHFQSRKVYYTDPIVETMESRENPGLTTTTTTTTATTFFNNTTPSTASERNFSPNQTRRFCRVTFDDPRVISRCVMNEDCWTIKLFKASWFRPVGSLSCVFGDDQIDEDYETERILKESAALENHGDWHSTSASLGAAASFQFFKPATIDFTTTNDNATNATAMYFNTHLDPVKMTNINDEYRRIHKQLTASRSEDAMEFLVVTTAKKVALFRSTSLYCCSATSRLFNLNVPFREESKHSNRLSIAMAIPELSCFIAVSQQGLVAIMRLCTYRGVYGMRQEHVFPNAMSLAVGPNGYRTIIGLSARKRGNADDGVGFAGDDENDNDGGCSYLLYVTYNDGTVVTCNLHE